MSNNQRLLNSVGGEDGASCWVCGDSSSLHGSVMFYSIHVPWPLLQSLPVYPDGGGNKSLLTLSRKYFQQGDVGLCRNWMIRKWPFSNILL